MSAPDKMPEMNDCDLERMVGGQLGSGTAANSPGVLSGNLTEVHVPVIIIGDGPAMGNPPLTT